MQTYDEVIQTLIKANDDLIAGTISLELARQVAINTQVVINWAKVRVDICKIQSEQFIDFFDPLDKPSLRIDEHIEEDKEMLRKMIKEPLTLDQEEPSAKTIEPNTFKELQEKKAGADKKSITAPMLKGMYSLTEDESERFFKYCQRHAIFYPSELCESFNEWKLQGKK